MNKQEDVHWRSQLGDVGWYILLRYRACRTTRRVLIRPRTESLRNYFTQFGKVDACTIMRDQDGRSRCFAFLTFEDPASVNAVMVREHFLDGKIVRAHYILRRFYPDH